MFLSWIGAESRCINWAITGRGNLNVDKVNRDLERAMASYYKFRQWREKVLTAVNREKSTANDLEAKRAELVEAEKLHAYGLAHNKFIRKNPAWTLEQYMNQFPEVKKEDVEKMLFWRDKRKDVWMTYMHTDNSRAKVKRVKERIALLERKEAQKSEENKVFESDLGYKFVENTDVDRYQLLFDGKPAPEVIKLLKSNGMRWSPKNKAWQRQITGKLPASN